MTSPDNTIARARLLAIGELSRRTGVNIETIRYYERIGLLAMPIRSNGGYRLYGPADVQRLTFIRRSRELGFSLDEIRTLLDLARGEKSCEHVRAITLHHAAEVRRKIADLERLERALAAMAALCDTAPPDRCPIIDALAASETRRVRPLREA
jgi:MerR family mercuric resistance operon transcriptional regulator